MPEPEQVIEEEQQEELAPEAEAEVQEEVQEELEEEALDDGQDELWNAAAPDLAESRADISPEALNRILLKKLAAKSTGDSTNGDNTNGQVASDGSESGTPPVWEMPTLDRDAVQRDFKEAIEEGDGEKAAALLGGVMDYQVKMSGLVSGALRAQTSEIVKITRPAQLRKAMTSVSGATESDIPRAQKLLDSGDAGNDLAAMRLAGAERREEIGSVQPSGGAKHKAKGMMAAKQANRGQRGGAPVQKFPENEQDLVEIYKREAENNTN